MRRFEFSEGTSDKFWQIDLSGNSFTVTWGKIGTNGQTQTKSFNTPQKALAEHDKLVKAKVNKGYTEVRGGSTKAPVTAAPATPASKPATAMAKPAAPPSAAPARAGSPTVDRKPVILTAGTAWTEDAKREVAPRRGSDFAPLRKGGGGSALSRIREAFKQAAAALDRGALRPDAEVALVTAAREAFGDRVPDLNREVDVQAAAYALIGPRLHWSERARSTDFIHYWNEVEGPIFALRALARAAEFKVFFGDVGEGQELAIINDPDVTVDVPPFREQDDETWRTMRHIVLAVGEVERAALEKIAVELRAKTDLWTRTLLTCALERSDWAKEDLEEGVAAAPRYGPGPWCWPLVLLLSFDQAETYFDRMGPSAWALLRGFEPLRFDLVATFGTDIAPRFIKAMTEGSAGIENRRAIAEALALMVTDDVVSFFLANLASNDLRAVARAYLVRHADASAVALAQAATGKGPVADAARAVLRGVVASRPDVIGRAKAEAPPAARAILEALEADTAPRAEADIAELAPRPPRPPLDPEVRPPAQGPEGPRADSERGEHRVGGW